MLRFAPPPRPCAPNTPRRPRRSAPEPGVARLWLVLDMCLRVEEGSASGVPWGYGLGKGRPGKAWGGLSGCTVCREGGDSAPAAGACRVLWPRRERADSSGKKRCATRGCMTSGGRIITTVPCACRASVISTGHPQHLACQCHNPKIALTLLRRGDIMRLNYGSQIPS